MKSKFILFEGINSLGKTTQANRQIERFKSEGMSAIYIKYPRYDLVPTGPRIWDYIRKGNPEKLNSYAFQVLNCQNKTDFAPNLDLLIEQHDLVIAEMYTIANIAFGMGDGIEKNELVEWNAKFRKPDLTILFDGEPFEKGIEKDHHYEQDQEKTRKIRQIFLDLMPEFSMQVINANRDEDLIHAELYRTILAKIVEPAETEVTQ